MDRTETTALLLEAKEGSDEALNRLLERCAGKLLALIRLRMDRGLRARVESRDILNATMLKAFQRCHSLYRGYQRSPLYHHAGVQLGRAVLRLLAR